MFRFNHDFSSRFRILKGGKVSLVVSAMLLGGTLQAVATSFNAEVTTSSPTFTVADDNNDSNNGVNDGELLGGINTCEILAGNHRYVAQSFIAGQTAPTDINTTSLTDFDSGYGSPDNFMAVYEGVFDPNNITKGLVGCNDDSKELWSEFTAKLDENKSYTMVFTAFSAVDPNDATSTTGEGNFSISPNVSLVTTTTATEDSALTYNLPSLAPADYNGTITKPSWITYSSGLSNSSLFADLGTNGGGYSTSGPVGMAVDPDGNIYVALSYGQIFKVTSSGVVSSLTTTGLTGGKGYEEIVYDNGYLYLTDGYHQKITKLNLSTNEITTVSDTLSYIPRTIIKSGNNIYFHIYNRSDIQWIPSIGTNGTPTSLTLTGATFDPMYVVDMVTDSLGDIYALTAKQKVGTVYKIDLDSAGTSGVVSQVTTTDFPMNETYPRQSGLAIDSKDNLYVLHQSMIEMIKRDGTPLGSTYTGGYSGDIAVDTNGNIYTSINNGGNSKIFKATNGAKLTGTPTNNDLGENRVTLSVDDGSTRDYIITVANTNDVPTLTTMSTLTDANQSIPKEITFANLQAAGDEADIDIDDNVTSFIVKSVTTGILKIGADYASAIAFDATTNKEINATNKAYWTATTAGSGINAFTVVAKDNHNGESTTPIQAKFDVAPDVTAPTLSATPQISGTTTVSQTSFTATASEASTGYWVVLPSSATAPSATQIVAGQDSTGTSTTIKGNSAMVADTNTTFTISGIDGDMEYKIYFVPKDSAGNLGELQTLSFSTPAYVHFNTSSTIADSSCWNGNIWVGNTTCSSTTIADIESKLQIGDVTISVSGDINITQPISWSANKLILTSNKNIHIAANMNISGTGGVEFKTGFDGTNYNGSNGLLYVDMDENHSFKGAVNLTDNSTLNINGNAYTIIRTLTDLTNWRATTSNGYHALGSNITMSGDAPAAMRTVGQALNGLGHTISGYHSTAGSNGVGKYVGFLRGIQGGEISNLAFVDVNISGDYGLGILTPNIDSVAGKTIKLYNLYTAGAVTETEISNSDTQAGGIASMINAYNGPFYMENVHSSANITAKDRLGGLFGLVGCSSSGAINTIKNISSSGTIVSIGNTAGGLIGNLYSGNGVTMNFSDLSFGGSVTGGATSTSIGGIIGNLSGGSTGLNTIKNVETNATVYGYSKVGGIVGETSTSINNISNTTFSGTITTPASALNIGGIVGYAGNTGTTISSNIFDGNISAGTGSTVIGGIVGYKNANVIDNSVKKIVSIDGTLYPTTDVGSASSYFGRAIGRQVSGTTSGNVSYVPTDLNITNASIAENNEINGTIGIFATTNGDTTDIHTYTLDCGTNNDNAKFLIDGNSLKARESFNYEAKSSYSICAKTTDDEGASFEKSFTISITNVDEPATASNMAAIVGPSSVNTFDTFIPTFTDPEGDAPTQLKITTLPSVGKFEVFLNGVWSEITQIDTNSPLIINMQDLANYRYNSSGVTNVASTTVEWSVYTSGGWSNSTTGVVTIVSSDNNDAPTTTITMDGDSISDTVVTINEDSVTNPIIVTFSDDYTPSQFLVGVVDSNNSSLVALTDMNITRIGDNNVSVIITPKANMYGDVNITLGAFDGDQNGTKSFVLRINPVNDLPTDINITNLAIRENNELNATIGTLGTVDIDTNDTYTYALNCGTNNDNDKFLIDGNTLKARESFNYEAKSSYNICVKTTDSGDATFDKNMTVTIEDVVEDFDISIVDGESTDSRLATANEPFTYTPTKEGYTFAGWYTDASFETAFDPRDPITANTTLYPKWVANSNNSVTMSVNTASYGVREVTLSTTQGLSVSNATNDATQTTAGKIKLPFGTFAFDISGGTNGFTAPMSIVVDKDVGSYTYYKQNNAEKWVNLTKKITFLPDDKVQIDFDLTDGGVFDRDGTANGTIQDPGGVATNALNPYVIEGTTLVGDASFVEDPSLFVGTVSYTITGGANSTLFEIDSATGELSFKNAPVYSTTTSNIYQVEVTASGSTSGKEIRAIMVTVLNADGDNIIAPVAVAESCGTSARQNFVIAPTAGLCQSGIASAVTTTTDMFTWSCNTGEESATPINCSAKKVNESVITNNSTITEQQTNVTDGILTTVTTGTNTIEATKFTTGDAKTEHIAKANGAELSKATSFVEGTQITVKSTGDVETSVEMISETNEAVSIKIEGKVSGDDKAIHTLNVGGKETKASSKITGTTTQIKADGEVETKATVSGNEAKATALPDGTATHIITVGTVESKATIEIAGAQTVIDNGGITTSVDDTQGGITVKSIVKTDTQGESQTWFEDSNGQQLERTVSAHTPLESGAEVNVSKDTNSGKLQFKIKTKVTRDLVIE